MESVRDRYKNFKAFCLQIAPDNDFVSMLQITTLDLFLFTIKSKISEYKSMEQTVDLIFEKAKIDRSTLNSFNLDKFTRFVEYFYSVCAVM